jgi:GNAT superfamily N-acetyltransferase
MNIQVLPIDLEKIRPFRDLYRQELNCQIVHDTAYDRKNCFQSFLLQMDGEIVGYGSTWIGDYWMAKGSLFEFYVTPSHRSRLFTLFEQFVHFIQPSRIYAQTNDPFLGVLIYDYTKEIVAEHILFKDGKTTNLTSPEVTFRRSTPADKDHIFKHHVEPIGDWLLEKEDRVIATGGVLYHYNRPYGDIFMEVDAEFRRRGFGQFLVQELKRVCYQSGSVPAARCRPTNIASRRTLEQAGLAPCGRLIYGEIA